MTDPSTVDIWDLVQRFRSPLRAASLPLGKDIPDSVTDVELRKRKEKARQELKDLDFFSDDDLDKIDKIDNDPVSRWIRERRLKRFDEP